MPKPAEHRPAVLGDTTMNIVVLPAVAAFTSPVGYGGETRQ